MPGDDTNSKTISAFYSYSHKDEKFREQLSSSLALLKRQQLIKEWYDGDMVPGEKWEKEIYEQLESSELILLLVSQDFINSDFIWGKELERAMARDSAGNARVVVMAMLLEERARCHSSRAAGERNHRSLSSVIGRSRIRRPVAW